jgi:hypothetical protein
VQIMAAALLAMLAVAPVCITLSSISLCVSSGAAGVALSGLLAVLTACQDLKATIGAKHHYLLYCLATAMKPRMLLTVDNEGQLLSVPVRVGQAVDVVAQAGRPKTITGGLLVQCWQALQLLLCCSCTHAACLCWRNQQELEEAGCGSSCVVLPSAVTGIAAGPCVSPYIFICCPCAAVAELFSEPVSIFAAAAAAAVCAGPVSCCPCIPAGFQTHTTPVLMSAGERAELGTEKYLPLTPILEGTVILKPNPDYVEVIE